tara:strand:- start:31 stop:957 length:927 start_codon:yes stop_codon:yes gene_type:complete
MNLKKPKFWDYKQPNIIAYSLYPLTFLVKLINLFHFKEKKNSNKIKTICIGNFYVGGTGKTSLAIKIKQLLDKKNIETCFIKKFYKDQTDEQKLLKKYGKLFSSTKRINSIIQAEKENYQIAILDDGLQDKSINCDLNFVCFNTINWKGNGMTIPAGPLRVNMNELRNYDHIFLNGNLENLDRIKKEIFIINSKINVHIGKYEPVNINEFDKNEKYFAFSGIGNHQTFISMLKNNSLNIVKDIEYADHYKFSNDEINEILNEANSLNCKVITTEKDYLRIENTGLKEIKFIKTELKIIDENKLINTIL